MSSEESQTTTDTTTSSSNTTTSSSYSSSSSSSGSGGSYNSQSTEPIDDTDYQEELIEDVSIWGLLTPLQNNYPKYEFIDERNEDYQKIHTFGRSPQCDYEILRRYFGDNDVKNIFRSVSKTHFTIRRIADEESECKFTTYIKDKSSNGCFLNGQLIGKEKELPLTNHSTIAVVKPEYKTFIFYNKRIQKIESDSLPDAFKEKYVLEHVLLGEGATGCVQRGRIKKNNEKVAIKIIKKDAELSVVPDLLYEANLVKDLKHPNVVKVDDLFETDKRVYIILEYMEGGELFDYVKSHGPLQEVKCKAWFLQLLEGVHFLHTRGIIHRDLKPENILLSSPDGNAILKITDFGLSRFVAEQSLLKTLVGTSVYLAPEILRMTGYTHKADLWSLGCILFIMLSGSQPFTIDNTEDGLFKKITNAEYNFNNPIWTEISEVAKDLLSHLLTPDPRKRISLREALEHQWFTGVAPPPAKRLKTESGSGISRDEK